MKTPSLLRVEYHDPKRFLGLYDCQEADHLAVQEWLDRHLRGDYLFKKGHLLSILRRPTSKLYAIILDGMYVGTIVFYDGSILHNIMIDPDYRGLGIGEACISFLNPAVIRAKTNMVAGDPVPFYQKLGYQPVGLDPNRPHIVIMEPETPRLGPHAGVGTRSLPAEVPPPQQGVSAQGTMAPASRPLVNAPGQWDSRAPGQVPILPPERCKIEEDAIKWREHKARQKKRQAERTRQKQALDAQYAQRYNPDRHFQHLNGDSDNGDLVHSE